MSKHFSMGAINKMTDSYEYPKIANKKNKYKCPSCEKDVLFRHGKIKQPHFAHYKSTRPCGYYDKPSETQLHKDAKLLMNSLLQNKRTINIFRICQYCSETREYIKSIKDEEYNYVTSVIEFRFDYNHSKRSADVALIKNNEIMYIFEICHTNKTNEENRPEPWFEFKAENLINGINAYENTNEGGEIELECIRDHKCDCCKNKELYENERRLCLLETMQQREKEQRMEKFELYYMRVEDVRSIELENNRIKREIINRKYELEKRAVAEREYEKERVIIQKYKEELEIQSKQEEFERQKYTCFLNNYNNKCNICKVNYCKCDKPSFVKNAYNKLLCNSCQKPKCKCVRITDFFKI